MTDTAILMILVPDTLKLINISSHPTIPTEYLALLGVILGASISIVGNLLLAKRQARIQIQNTFFTRRLEVYIKLAEMSWEGYSTKVRTESSEKIIYPQAYDSFQHLLDWLEAMVELIDKNRLLLDQETYRKFNALNQKIIEDADEIRAVSETSNIDLHTRKIGAISTSAIQHLSEELVNATRNYIKKTYKVDLEKVL